MRVAAISSVVIFTLLILLSTHISHSQTAPPEDVCYRWTTQVDPSLKRVDIDESALTETAVFEGIECLLKLQGNRNKARFTGYTNVSNEVSSPPPLIKKPANIEIAALYYFAYVFYNDWGHAGSVRLYDQVAEKNSMKKKFVRRAYKSYIKWFENLKKIGLQEGRKQKLDPLEGSGIAWS